MACLHLGKPWKKLAAIIAEADECRQPNCQADPYDLWVCLHEGCGFVACGRGSKGHAKMHWKQKRDHHVAMGTKQGQLWCYTCDSEVLEAERGPSDYNQRIRAFRAMAIGSNIGGTQTSLGPTALAVSATAAAGGIPSGPLFPVDFMTARAPDADSAMTLANTHSLAYAPNAGLTGLSNLGNTCFLAAALQALSNVSPLSAYLCEVPFAAAPDRVEGDPKMPAAMRGLMLHLWDVQPRTADAGSAPPPLRPSHVLNALRRLSPLFEGFAQQDAHEALRTILADLHDRLAVDMPVGLYSNDHGAPAPPLSILTSDSGAESEPAAVRGGATRSSAGQGTHGSPMGGAHEGKSMSLRDLRQAQGKPGSTASSGSISRPQTGGAAGHPSSKSADSDDSEGDAVGEGGIDQGQGKRKMSRYEASAAGVGGSSGMGGGAGSPTGREWLNEGPYTGPDVISRSIVSDLFQGVFSSRVRCRVCKTHSITYEPFMDLSLSLPRAVHPISRGGDGTLIPPEAVHWMKEGDAESVMAELESGSSTSGSGPGSGVVSSGEGSDAEMRKSSSRGSLLTSGSKGETGGSSAASSPVPVIVSNKMRLAVEMDEADEEVDAHGHVGGQAKSPEFSPREALSEHLRRVSDEHGTVSGELSVDESAPPSTGLSRILSSLLCFLHRGVGVGSSGGAGPQGTVPTVSGQANGVGATTAGWASALGMGPVSGLGLGDLLYNFFSWDGLTGSDMYACETCGKKVEADRRVSIAALPEVLVVHLKRFAYNGWGSKNGSNVAYPLSGLDLTPFLWEGAHVQAVRSFSRAKEQQVGQALGSKAGGSSGRVAPSARRGAGATSSKGSARVVLEMSPDARAVFLHRHSLAQGPAGVEVVVAQAEAVQGALQCGGGKRRADEEPLLLRFPSSFAAAYLGVSGGVTASAGFALPRLALPHPPSGGALLPTVFTGPVPVPQARRLSPTTLGGCKYDLASVVQHMGVLSGGHYVAHAVNRLTGKWHTYDDTYVSPLDGDAVARKEGYILFYQRSRPTSGAFAPAVLPPKDRSEASPLFVSRYWWLRYKHLSVPGPVTNGDILCDHGCVKNDLADSVEPAKLVVALTLRQYEVLATTYGASEPPLRSLERCSTCVAEGVALKSRRQRERERITKVDTTSLPQGAVCWYLVSEKWLSSWRAFINDTASVSTGRGGVGDSPHTDGTGRGLLPPGPIDNARLLGKDGRVLKNLRPSTHYRGVNEAVWKFLVGIYGGGPIMRRREINIYGEEAPA